MMEQKKFDDWGFYFLGFKTFHDGTETETRRACLWENETHRRDQKTIGTQETITFRRCRRRCFVGFFSTTSNPILVVIIITSLLLLLLIILYHRLSAGTK